MYRSLLAAILIGALSFSVNPASATTFEAKITADNHYAIYYGGSDGILLTYVGRNELNSGGSPGTYNWSEPETFSFTTDQYIYVVGWSDDSVAQAWMGEFVANEGSLYSDNSWEVYLTFDDLDDGSPAPTAGEVGVQVTFANLFNGWTPVAEVRSNGAAPWGTVAGLSSSANWIWGSAMEPGSSYGEYQIFRHSASVPEPASLFLLGSGILAAAFRRRRAR